jgi:sugar phosphate isomerase/epimerase
MAAREAFRLLEAMEAERKAWPLHDKGIRFYFARDFGCSVVGTETGSLNSDFSFHPGNRGEEAFQVVVAGVRELVEEAERFGVFAGIGFWMSCVREIPRSTMVTSFA